MQDYFYIRENIKALKLEEKLFALSRLYENKKVAFIGANSLFKVLCEQFDLNQLFDIAGISDGNIKNIEALNDEFRVIPFENLYFSGIDLLINLKDDGKKIEKYLRKNNLIKKRVKFVNLLDKSCKELLLDYLNLSMRAFTTYKKTGQFSPIIDDFVNYKSDVVKSRLNYSKKIFEISENKSNPIRVLFLVFDYRFWTLNDLYFKMRSDKDFKILPIVVLPNILSDNDYNSTDETLKYFKDNGYNCIEGMSTTEENEAILKALKPDVIIYQQAEYLKSDYKPSCLSEYALTCFIDSDYKYEKNEKRSMLIDNVLSNTWKIYSADTDFYKLYKNTEFLGYTQYEKYFDREILEKDNDINQDSIQNNKIVYCSNCEIDEDFDKSKFLNSKNAMFEYASSHNQYDFVFVLDKKFKKLCVDKNIFTTDEFDKYINKWSELPNVTVKDYTNIVSVCKSSNILITDSYSCAFENFPCGKPIILISKNQTKQLDAISELMYKTFYKLPSTEPLDIVLEDLLSAKNDYNSKNRIAILNKYNSYFNKKSSDLIINDLKINLNRLKIDKKY